MGYVDAHLLPGERVVYRTRLHRLLFLSPLLLILVVLLPIAWLLARGSASAYAWTPVGLGALLLFGASIQRQSSDFVETNKRVMAKVGVIHTRSIELLLGRIEAIAVEPSLPGRLLGYGDIVITGSGGTKEALWHIQSPLAFRTAVQSVSDSSTSPAAGR